MCVNSIFFKADSHFLTHTDHPLYSEWIAYADGIERQWITRCYSFGYMPNGTLYKPERTSLLSLLGHLVPHGRHPGDCGEDPECAWATRGSGEEVERAWATGGRMSK